MNTTEKFLITTPIYYINDKPHIGHAYSTIAADVLARYWRDKIGGENVRFSTGTDENSKKTVEAAKEAGQDIKDYTNETAKLWRHTWDKLNISYDDFVRTTEPRHIKAVQTFLSTIKENNPDDIYQDTYEGLYCYRCEAFYKEEELVEGKCPIHKTEVELIREDNWFFRLSKYSDKVKAWINSQDSPVRPQARKNEVLAFIERGLEDISISRANQTIGIDLPFDESQKIYVWVDALINYLTVAGYPDERDWQDWWKGAHHIIGKDIIKFHCIIWPALLIAAGINPPKQIFAHGFFTIDGEKISKSTGNSIDPITLSEKYGNDALRYYLLREIPFGADGDFSHERFEAVYNADLANDLGNLVSRVVVMIRKYCDGQFYVAINPPEINNVNRSTEQLEFSIALDKILERINHLNRRIEEVKPWALVKSDKTKTSDFLSEIACEIRALEEQYLRPYLPYTAEIIEEIFRGGDVRSERAVKILFPKHK